MAWSSTTIRVGGAHQRVRGIAQRARWVDLELYDKVGRAGLDMSDNLARPGYVLVKGSSNHQVRARMRDLASRVFFEMTAARDGQCS
jgi:hypothetical protein